MKIEAAPTMFVVAMMLLPMMIDTLPLQEAADSDKRRAGGDRPKARKSKLPPVVAFTAMMTDRQTPTDNEHDVVRFHHVETNAGDGFNKSTSQFEAPASGLYFFTYTLYSGTQSGTSQSDHSLVKNDGEVIVSSLMVGDGRMVSNSAIVELNVGDRVYLLMYKNSTATASNAGLYSNEHRLGSFSGHVLAFSRDRKSSRRHRKERKGKGRRTEAGRQDGS